MSDLPIGTTVATYSGKRGTVIAREPGRVSVQIAPFRTNYHAGRFVAVRNLVVTYPRSLVIEARNAE